MVLDPHLIIKKDTILKLLGNCESVLVAFSGGVDSALLLALSVEALGAERVLAVTGVSPSLASGELDEARAVARQLGARHEAVPTGEIERADYRANRGDRCFHCRSELFDILERVAVQQGLRQIAYGAIADDLGDDRPGMRAAGERKILAPLLDAGLTKDDVRALAADAGLSVREKPASACLASRIPVGTEVTPERLEQIDRAESALRELGLGQLRVRHHGDVARVELADKDLARLSDPEVRAEIARRVREAGFRYVSVDLEGYRTGSMNAPEGPELYRIGPARESGQ